MNQQQEADKRTSLDTISEDVAVAIARVVQSWAEEEPMSFEEREKAKK